MQKIITFKTAARLSLFIIGFFILFHLLVIIGIVGFNYIPIDFLWGGRMETPEQLLGFELISLFVMKIYFVVVMIKAELIKMSNLIMLATIILWILFFVFLLNTVGNLLAKTMFEKFFSLITAILAFLSLRLAIEKSNKKEET